eukprot:CAMPEP_0118988694 /NCGR_PEP_ID=MMETSP1173-20130426/46668_1 /TAXON_ID=1034831 /ORGANISM="Rhizochromulina marina cf, Strain CCMP1243" /LENGTH=106 /DNA_ID=CAMNT_0006939633 /DNA_START=61 /DNA_END=378 /DNA_ORIENTATION=+
MTCWESSENSQAADSTASRAADLGLSACQLAQLFFFNGEWIVSVDPQDDSAETTMEAAADRHGRRRSIFRGQALISRLEAALGHAKQAPNPLPFRLVSMSDLRASL